MNSPRSTDHNLYAAIAAAQPDPAARVLTTESGAHYTWAELDAGSARIAHWLAALDLPAGARVAVQVDKSVAALMLYLGTLRAGYVYLPLNTAYQASELDYFLDNAAPSVFICSSAHHAWAASLAAQRGVAHIHTLDADGSGSLTEATRDRPTTQPIAPCTADQLAVILYTSGTTGRSKGAMLSHGNMLANARTLLDHWDWRRDDVLLHALPIFHIHGLMVAIHCALLGGSRLLWFNSFHPGRVSAQLPQATVFMGVPTLYTRLLAEPGFDAAACRNMRLFISGSAPLLPDTFHSFRARSGHTILERYGMSETIMLASNPCRPADGERIAGTVGRPLPGVELRICGDGDVPCAVDAVGGIQVRGPNVFQGYWQMPEKTAEEFTADGWFRTGDVGSIDAAGYVRIVGRSKDLIISGGYNVYPAEVEHCLNAQPGVLESAVIAAPHPDFGEAVVAVVVPRPGATLDPDALIAQLKTQLANYKVPKRLFVETELPRNVMGKVQKNLLRAQHSGLFTQA